MATDKEQPELRAAGGLVWSAANGPDRKLVVVHRAKRKDWALPKGKPETDEAPEETALREAMEETGCNLRLGNYAGRYQYVVKGRLKVVDMWHMVRLPGEYLNRAPLREIDEVVWLAPTEAIERLTHPVEREFVAAHAAEMD